MKLNNTFILINSGAVAETNDWKNTHAAIQTAISNMSWPVGSKEELVIPRIASVKHGEKYTSREGKTLIWKGEKPKILRNGVTPLRQLFRKNLEGSGWRAEQPLSLKAYFEKVRSDKNLVPLFRYPIPALVNAVDDPLHESIGDFDFWLQSNTGFRTVVEWETGNISSSHRSLNKMCLALMGELVDAAVLVVPSIKLYPHLTDRIGNIKELQPYFYFWNRVGTLVSAGLLAVMEVEQNALRTSKNMRDFIPSGQDGNAFRA